MNLPANGTHARKKLHGFVYAYSWHVERFRAQGTKVEVFENADEVEFSIIHGSLFRRQRVVENGRFGFHSFWPVQSASAIYNREFGELRITG